MFQATGREGGKVCEEGGGVGRERRVCSSHLPRPKCSLWGTLHHVISGGWSVSSSSFQESPPTPYPQKEPQKHVMTISDEQMAWLGPSENFTNFKQPWQTVKCMMRTRHRAVLWYSLNTPCDTNLAAAAATKVIFCQKIFCRRFCNILHLDDNPDIPCNIVREVLMSWPLPIILPPAGNLMQILKWRAGNQLFESSYYYHWPNIEPTYLAIIIIDPTLSQPTYYYYWPNLITANQSPLLSLWYRPIHAESCNNKFIQFRNHPFPIQHGLALALAYIKAMAVSGTESPKLNFYKNNSKKCSWTQNHSLAVYCNAL